MRTAASLLDDFTRRTGVVGPPVRGARYLWTDAYAVMAYLSLHEATGDREHLDRALRLIDLVHQELGQHRGDDGRTGWLSGSAPGEGGRSPTLGGLRIGKPRPERTADEPLDQRAEWDRDGQYFHYLTRWMDALERTSRATGDSEHLRHAMELAEVAHRAFAATRPDGSRGIHWKMSIDLSRPLVSSMGQHDALDGLATFARLEVARRESRPPGAPDLEPALDVHLDMCRERHWGTEDELGLGGLLANASTLMDAVAAGVMDHPPVLDDVLADAESSLRTAAGMRDFEEPAESRLAFRELGLAIGLQAAEPMLQAVDRAPSRFRRRRWILDRISTLASRRDIAERIRRFWLGPAHRRERTWVDHEDINSVMLATSLVPEACLARLGGPRPVVSDTHSHAP